MPSPKKILVLDDSAFNREMLKDILEDGGYDTEAVGDLPGFEKALSWWHPDAIVVDVNMPGLSGTDVVRMVKDDKDAPPVILMSAMAAASLEKLAEECGATACFSTLSGTAAILDVLAPLFAPPPDDGSPGW